MKKMIRFLWYVGIIFAILLVCISLPTGRIARHYLEDWLTANCTGTASIRSVSFNPFLFTVNIQNAMIQNRDVSLFSVETVHLDISLWGLLQRDLIISEAEIKGVRSSLKINAGLADADKLRFLVCRDGKTSNNSIFAVLRRLRLSRATVTGGTLILQMPKKERTLRIKKMLIWDGLVEEGSYRAAVSLNGSLDNATVKIESAVRMKSGRGNATGNLDVKNFAVSDFQDLLPPYFADLQGSISTDARLEMEMDGDLIEITQKGKGTLKDFQVEVVPYAVTSQAADFQTDLLVTIRKGEPVSSRMVASIRSEGGEVTDTDTDFMIIAWKEAGAERVELSYRDSFSFASPAVRAVMVVGARPPGRTYEKYPLLSAGTALAEDIQISAQDIRIGRIILDNMEAVVVLDPDAMPVNIPEVLFIERNEERRLQAALLPPAEGEIHRHPVDFRVDRLTVTGDSQFACIDESTNPVFSERFRINMADIQSMNIAGALRQVTAVADLEGENGAKLHLDTGLVPVEDSSSLTVWNTVSDYPAASLSPYTRTMWGVDIMSGRLTAETSIAAADDQLSGEMLLQLRGIELVPSVSPSGAGTDSLAVMPLDSAMGYLVDANGDGEILVPVTGERHDPVQIASRLFHHLLPAAIRSAAYRIVKKEILSFHALVPPGEDPAVYDGKLIAGLRLDPVVLDPGEVLPGKNGDEYTRELSELLKKDSRLRIKIIGVSTPRDRKAVQMDKEETGKGNTVLSLLARERADTFREILVLHYGVPASRIAGCLFRVDTGKGDIRPRIEIIM